MKPKKIEVAFGVFLVFAFAFAFAILGWSMTHPTQDETIRCIRAGYERAVYIPSFSYSVYCQKSDPMPVGDDDNGK